MIESPPPPTRPVDDRPDDDGCPNGDIDCHYERAAHRFVESGYDATILDGYAADWICPNENEARAKYGDR